MTVSSLSNQLAVISKLLKSCYWRPWEYTELWPPLYYVLISVVLVWNSKRVDRKISEAAKVFIQENSTERLLFVFFWLTSKLFVLHLVTRPAWFKSGNLIEWVVLPGSFFCVYHQVCVLGPGDTVFISLWPLAWRPQPLSYVIYLVDYVCMSCLRLYVIMCYTHSYTAQLCWHWGNGRQYTWWWHGFQSAITNWVCHCCQLDCLA